VALQRAVKIVQATIANGARDTYFVGKVGGTQQG